MSNSKQLTIGVIFGGRSSEHEVSLVSARSIMANLDKKKYKVVPILISKRGDWSEFVAKFRRQDVDVYWPIIHGTTGEDGVLQGLLEIMSKPYVGCGVLSSALGLDKVIQKQLFKNAGLPVVNFIWFKRDEWKMERLKILRRLELGTKKEQRIGYPCFVKPANLGSSIGVTKAHNRTELIQGIAEAFKYDLKILVEAAVEPAREFEIAVFGNDKIQTSGVGEIISSKEFYDYEAKYLDGGSLTKIPAAVPRVVATRLQKIANKAFTTLDGAGLARVDFLMNTQTGQLYLNEINTAPGFTSISMYPKLWAKSGLSYSQLLDKLITLARLKFKERSKLRQLYEPPKKWWG